MSCATLRHLPLPGRFVFEPGSAKDYFELERFHYLPGRPSTWDQVWVIRYRPPDAPRGGRGRIVAVGVLSWPVPLVAQRHRALNMRQMRFGQRLRFANRHIRTISRVVVHPQFRSLGLASRMVQWLCRNCTTRYVEALAVMGRAHPFFEKAGMTRIDPPDDDPRRPVYFIFDRHRRLRLGASRTIDSLSRKRTSRRNHVPA